MHRKRWACAALAATALSAPAWATDTVTLYGTADTGLGSTRTSYRHGGAQASISQTGMRDNQLSDSAFGIRGSEALGSQTQVLFRLESGLHLSDGAAKSNFWERHAWVGLRDTRWGTFTLGRQPDVSKDFVQLNVTGEGMGKIERAFGGKGTRRSGLFKYVTPTWGGAQLGAAYSRREDGMRNFYNVGARYKNGPASAVATYAWAQNEGQDYTVKNWLVGGAWDFKVVKLLAAYGQDRNGKFNTAGDVQASDFGADKALMQAQGLGAYNQHGAHTQNYYLAAQAPVGPGTLGASFSHSIANLGDFGYASHSQNIAAVMYAYHLSKRTALYGYGTWSNGIAYLDGLRTHQFGLGLRHRF